MKIKRPESPLQPSTEALDQDASADLSKVVANEFADALTQLESTVDSVSPGRDHPGGSERQHAVRAALARIANAANLSNAAQANAAVLESARYMIRSRLPEKFLASSEGSDLVTGLSDYVAQDPLLKPKLLSILKRIKAG
jgi:hypothetical protein